MLRFDAAAAAGPLNHARSQVAPVIVPITLGYFVFDLLLLPWWEGSFKVSQSVGRGLGGWPSDSRVSHPPVSSLHIHDN